MQRFTRRFMAACVLSTVVASGAAIANDHPTIRAMSGAEQIKQLPAAKTALIVIDFQNEYFTGRMPIPDGASALAKTRELINYADSHKIPVYHVQHVSPAGVGRAPSGASQGYAGSIAPGTYPGTACLHIGAHRSFGCSRVFGVVPCASCSRR